MLAVRAGDRVNCACQFENLVGQLDQLPVLLVLFLHHLVLLVGGGLSLEVGPFWLIITNVDRKIASSDTIIVNSPNG